MVCQTTYWYTFLKLLYIYRLNLFKFLLYNKIGGCFFRSQPQPNEAADGHWHFQQIRPWSLGKHFVQREIRFGKESQRVVPFCPCNWTKQDKNAGPKMIVSILKKLRPSPTTFWLLCFFFGKYQISEKEKRLSPSSNILSPLYPRIPNILFTSKNGLANSQKISM